MPGQIEQVPFWHMAVLSKSTVSGQPLVLSRGLSANAPRLLYEHLAPSSYLGAVSFQHQKWQETTHAHIRGDAASAWNTAKNAEGSPLTGSAMLLGQLGHSALRHEGAVYVDTVRGQP